MGDFGFSILICLILDSGFWNLDFGCLHVRLFGFLNFWDFAFCDLDSGCWIVVVGTCILYLLILGFGLAFEILWSLYFGFRFFVFGLWIPEFVTFFVDYAFRLFCSCNLDFGFCIFSFWLLDFWFFGFLYFWSFEFVVFDHLFLIFLILYFVFWLLDVVLLFCILRF